MAVGMGMGTLYFRNNIDIAIRFSVNVFDVHLFNSHDVCTALPSDGYNEKGCESNSGCVKNIVSLRSIFSPFLSRVLMVILLLSCVSSFQFQIVKNGATQVN